MGLVCEHLQHQRKSVHIEVHVCSDSIFCQLAIWTGYIHRNVKKPRNDMNAI